MSPSEQRLLIDRAHPALTIAEQCAALGLSRSTLYYKPRPASEEDLQIMRLMDELHLEDPTRGQRRMLLELTEQGFKVGRDRVRSLMRRMRLCCVYRREADHGGRQGALQASLPAVRPEGIRISMDGKGRAIDNVFIERFWRTLKHEHIYLRPPEDGVDLCRTCAQFIHYYNHRRKHSSIGNVPPVQRLPMAA
jgi:hypothetical protein